MKVDGDQIINLLRAEKNPGSLLATLKIMALLITPIKTTPARNKGLIRPY